VRTAQHWKAPPEREKETRGKDSSPGKQANPNKVGHKVEREPLRTEPSTSHMEHINQRPFIRPPRPDPILSHAQMVPLLFITVLWRLVFALPLATTEAHSDSMPNKWALE